MNRNIGKPFSAFLIAAIMVLLAFSAMCTSASAATPEEVEMSIQNGTAWLAANQNLDGSWGASYEIATTGLVLYKLIDRAYELDKDPLEVCDPGSETETCYEYAQNVKDGLNFTMTYVDTVQITPQDHTAGATGTVDDPDTNGNGIGLVWQCSLCEVTPCADRQSYTTGIMTTMLSLLNGSEVVAVGPYTGMTYAVITQDAVDWLAFAQTDSGPDEGGWEYAGQDNGSNGDADNSVSGYVTLGLSSAQAAGYTVPDWVKTELDVFITMIQDPVNGDVNDGGSWYRYDWDWVNTLKTGNLIQEMTFCGDSNAVPRKVNATDYLENHFYDMNPDPGWGYSMPTASYQTMFTIMKGLEFSGIDLLDLDGDSVPETDWWMIFADNITAQEISAGPGLGYWHNIQWGTPELCTAWALLTLEKTAPPPPQLVTVEKDFRYTSVDFVPMLWVDDTPDILDDNVGHWEQQPAILGGLLPKDIVDPDPDFYDVRYVLKSKKGTVSSTNPGQLYGVINITGVGVTNVSVNDTFGTQFDVNPGKLGGGVEVIRVNATGYATVLTGTSNVTSATVDNDGQVTLVINLTSPLGPDENLMIYVKFETALKHSEPDWDDFVNTAEVIVDEGNPIETNATIEFY